MSQPWVKLDQLEGGPFTLRWSEAGRDECEVKVGTRKVRDAVHYAEEHLVEIGFFARNPSFHPLEKWVAVFDEDLCSMDMTAVPHDAKLVIRRRQSDGTLSQEEDVR